MPIVQVQVWQGFGEDRARRLIEGITASFEQVGVPAVAVQVVIQEVPRTHWGVGGQVSSSRTRQEGAPRPARDELHPRGDRRSGSEDTGQEEGRGAGRGGRSMGPGRPAGAGFSRTQRPVRPAGKGRSDSRPGRRPRRGGGGAEPRP